MTDRPWSSTAPPGEFRTYISAEETVKEFTVRAVILGSLFGLLFGAVTVYVGLRAGLTVSASIPIAVLSISILRAFGRSTILENNIVQTTGSAGESLAAGVIFTMPALIFLGFGSEFTCTGAFLFWRCLADGSVCFSWFRCAASSLSTSTATSRSPKARPALTFSWPASAAARLLAAFSGDSASAAPTPFA